MGDGPGRSDESGNITHLKLNKGKLHREKTKNVENAGEGQKNGEKNN